MDALTSVKNVKGDELQASVPRITDVHTALMLRRAANGCFVRGFSWVAVSPRLRSFFIERGGSTAGFDGLHLLCCGFSSQFHGNVLVWTVEEQEARDSDNSWGNRPSRASRELVNTLPATCSASILKLSHSQSYQAYVDQFFDGSVQKMWIAAAFS